MTHATTSSDLVEGDTIYVMPGTYTGALNPSVDGTSTKPIRYIADSDGSIFGTAGTVTLIGTSGNETLDMDDDDYLEFVGFRIQGVSGSSQ